MRAETVIECWSREGRAGRRRLAPRHRAAAVTTAAGVCGGGRGRAARLLAARGMKRAQSSRSSFSVAWDQGANPRRRGGRARARRADAKQTQEPRGYGLGGRAWFPLQTRSVGVCAPPAATADTAAARISKSWEMRRMPWDRTHVIGRNARKVHIIFIKRRLSEDFLEKCLTTAWEQPMPARACSEWPSSMTLDSRLAMSIL